MEVLPGHLWKLHPPPFTGVSPQKVNSTQCLPGRQPCPCAKACAPCPAAPSGCAQGWCQQDTAWAADRAASPKQGPHGPQAVPVQPRGHFDLVKGISESPARQLRISSEDFSPEIPRWPWPQTPPAPPGCACPCTCSSTGRTGPAAHTLPQKVPVAEGRRSPALSTAPVEKGHNERAEDAQSRQPRAALSSALCHEPRKGHSPWDTRHWTLDTAPSSTGKGPALQLCPQRWGCARTPLHGHWELPQKRETAPPVPLAQDPGPAELWPRGSAGGRHVEVAPRAVGTFPGAGTQPGPAPPSCLWAHCPHRGPGEHPSLMETCPSPECDTRSRRSSARVAAISQRIIQG